MVAPSRSVVVGKANIMSVRTRPTDYDAPLVVDADAVEALLIAAKRLQSIVRRRLKVLKALRGIQHNLRNETGANLARGRASPGREGAQQGASPVVPSSGWCACHAAGYICLHSYWTTTLTETRMFDCRVS